MNTDSASPQPATLAKLLPSTVRTPPESPTLPTHENSATVLPISPPATVVVDSPPQPFSRRIRRVLSLIRLRYHGRPLSSTWERVHISLKEFELVQHVLNRDTHLGRWVEDKLRYDFDSVDGEFVLRMPSPLHDIFAGTLLEVIVQKLKAFTEQDEVRMVVERIKPAFSSDIRFGTSTTKDKKSPDGSFRFSGTKHPPLVIELANSQKSKDLPRLAESYIERTEGETKTVITIDLEYRSPNKRADSSLPPRSATYSIYRSKLVRDEQTGNWYREASADVEDQYFRMDDLTVPEGSMSLLLSDFCPDETLTGIHDQTISISHAELAVLLKEAEIEEATAEALSSSNSSKESFPFVSKRKRSPTPTLTSEDEAEFERVEAAVEARELLENSSFSSTDVVDVVEKRVKKVKTRSKTRSQTD